MDITERQQVINRIKVLEEEVVTNELESSMMEAELDLLYTELEEEL